jgi:hypothetical protein
VKPKTCLLVFSVCLLCLVLKARSAEISYSSSLDGLPQYAQVASTGGIVYRSQTGGAMLCMGGCVRLYGSNAPNGSRANVIGVWTGRKDNSITVVRESWTRPKS